MADNKKTGMGNPPMGMRRGPGRMGEVEKAKDRRGTLKRMLAYFAAEKKRVLLLFIAVAAGVLCGILAPDLQSKAIDAIAERRFADLPGVLLLMAALYLVSCFTSFLQGLQSAHLSQDTVRRIREDLFQCITALPVGYLDTHSHGDIMSRMTNDVENISSTVSQSVSSLFSGVLMVIGTVGMMIYLCPPLAALSCTTVIFTAVATKFLSAAMRKAYRKRQALLGNLNGTVEEMVSGYHTVAAFEREEAVIGQFEDISNELTRVGIRADVLGGTMGPLMNVINNAGFVIIAAFGGYFALKGMISIGVISAFIIYAKQFGRPIDEIAQVWGQIQTAIAGAERVFGVMDVEPESKGGRIKMEELGEEVEITFEHVNFSYVPGQRVLHDFNLAVKPGQKIALVGSTGSGKTTAVNLLMRFYEPDDGSIKINGTDIRMIDRDSLRDATAIVLQDTVLFADSVRSNLKYADRNVKDAEMFSFAVRANVDRMIRKLERGYSTVLTADGDNLSEGQKQLLSITRAFISKPRILILDEATSNVDTRTEKNIQDAMVKLMKGRTSLVIAHRLSTIRDADVIVVMDQGRIVEQGDHETLLAQKGKYYELYMTQFAGRSI